jgi:hypothetical protein
MKYDPNRKYKKGDIVRITGYRGRLFGYGDKRELEESCKLGIEVVLDEDEDYGGDVVVPAGILKGNNVLLSCSCIELVKPVEEIGKNTYEVFDTGKCFQIRDRDCCIYAIYWETYSCPRSPYNREEALSKANELCDELNNKK